MDTAIKWETLSLTDDLVKDHLVKARRIMIDDKSRSYGGRRHLRALEDSNGWYVRIGRRGAHKERLGRCKVIYLDGRATLFKFTFASQDEFDAEQERLFCEKYGINV